jgi:putative membrane protein
MSSQAELLPPPDELRSLHPLTLVFDAIGAVRILLVPTLLLFVFSSGSPSSFIPLVIAAGMQVYIGTMRFVSMRYGIHRRHLVIQEGVFSRRVRTIPIATIQNIFLRRNLLHRLLGVCELRVETAGGGQAEARLSVVAEGDAQSVRRRLIESTDGPSSLAASLPTGAADAHGHAAAQPALGRLIRKSTLAELFLAGATASRAGAIFLVLIGLLEFVDQFEENVQRWLRNVSDVVLGSIGDNPVVLAAFGILVIILVGWVVSIFLTLLRFYGFTLHRTPDAEGLHRSQGLFTQFEGVLPLDRIQILRVDANPPRRLLGYGVVRAETAGSVEEKESAGSTTLCPLLRKAEIAGFCRTIFPRLDFDESLLRPVHRAALRRGFVRYLLLLGILSLVASAIFEQQPWFYLGAALVLSWPLAVLRYRAMGWAVDEDFVISRSGVFIRRSWIVPISRIQSLGITQSPAQRILHIATLTVDTAGALRFQSARIIDLPLGTAHRLYEELSRGAAYGATHDGI